MDEIGKQLKKGVLEIVLLKLLSLENMYGYRLVQELESRSNGVFRMKEGTLYPVLYRLEDAGLIESYWEQETDRRAVPRKYYRITPRGIQELTAMVVGFEKLTEGVHSILRLEGKTVEREH